MHNTLRTKVVLWFVVILGAMAGAAWVGHAQLQSYLREQMEAQAESRLAHVVDVLRATDETYSAMVRASMQHLRSEALERGTPRRVQAEGGAEQLWFGSLQAGETYEIVDAVTQLMGGTATLFVRQGEEFIRVSTNVRKADGERATGTRLDPEGKAIAKIREGKAFYGVVDILGKPYLTGYEPITTGPGGEVIGVYYVGYALDTLTSIANTLNERGLMKHGFFALADPQDQIVCHTEGVAQPEVAARVARAAALHEPVGEEWAISRATFKPWDYDILGALYLPDIRALTLSILAKTYGVTGAVLLAVLAISFWLTTRLSHALEEAEAARREALEARDAAETANRTKSAFLANMSHELRTPMNAIIGYSEMLIEEAEDLGQDEMVPDLQKIRAAGKHLLSLINDVLDLSKIEAGKMTLYVEPFAVDGMLDEVITTIQPLLEKNGNRFTIIRGAGLGEMQADLTKVRQTLFNLLSNATKFTEKGQITLRTERVAAPGGERVRLSVQDSGIGMSAEQLARLFKAFTQADASTTRKYGGTGLGLVISRRFCQMMGGDITVESRPGEGSCFTVDLPATVPVPEEAARVETAPVVPEPEPGSARRKVLIIDDDATAADLLRRTLEKAGFEALVATDGASGIELARRHQPSAITLDVMMPGMDGWSVLTQLKNDPALSHIPVIMATMLQDRPMGFALGASDFLTKPVDPARLRNILSRLCGGGQRRVLIVDDDTMSRDVLRRLLEKEGIGIEEAVHGSAALEAIARERPDLILLDLMMPVMDGFGFLNILRSNPETKEIPVVVVTAKDLTEEDRARLNGSVQNVIQKGALDRESLLREVCALIAQTATTAKP